MSPKKPTVDDLDDVDYQDGAVQAGARKHSDLKLHVRRADEVALGGASAPDEGADDKEER